MPTTKLKNILYQAALPFLAPAAPRHPILSTEGQQLTSPRGLERLARKHHLQGGICLLSDGKQTSLSLLGSKLPGHTPRADYYFRVASITKMVTALCALRLVEKGLMQLDTPADELLKTGDEALQGVTLRQLLCHTSGLHETPEALEKQLLQGASTAEAVHGRRFSDPAQPVFHYSNLGFGLIGCMMEAATGVCLSDLADQLVFQPLKMRATLDASRLDPAQIMPICRILPWHRGADLRITALGKLSLTQPDPQHHYGHTAGSLYTDGCSLLRLMEALRDHALLSENLSAEMQKEQAAYGPLDPRLFYGLGLFIIKDARLSAHRILGHQGFAYGCVDGAFWEEDTGRIAILLDGGGSEARAGRLGLINEDLLHWAFREELPSWEK